MKVSPWMEVATEKSDMSFFILKWWGSSILDNYDNSILEID